MRPEMPSPRLERPSGAGRMERLGADSRRGQLLRTPANTGWRLMQAVWRFVRQVSGDDAYERYRDHILQAHPGQPAMTRTAYYRFRTEQKWNRITRCC